ncbi:MAG: lysine--tRNA ligase [Candidatus Marsarchaeota archaeon]|jgi:lysyl-tRNA synthetase class 1|nr:lysine--tRNA ligase [Candidatus Marsarchaeota archaeon]
MDNESILEDNKPQIKGIEHWSTKLANEVISKKSPPFVITGGMTTSGPAHLGTVCEFLYPSVIKKSIEALGHDIKFYFVGDILDAFDSIPEELNAYSETLKAELGKPLARTLDPKGCHNSFGEHYLMQAVDIMHLLNIDINVIRATQLYTDGSFDVYTKKYLQNEDIVRDIVARTSGRESKDFASWSPIMPICQNCGRIATTRVIQHNDTEYEYACDKDVGYVKGCGHSGKNDIRDHEYKLQWRLHWSAWQAWFRTSIEGSGVDHMTKGGSKDTSFAVLKDFFNIEPPVYYKYGFVLFHGKKYSKSKGIGVSAADIVKLIPPELLIYMLTLPNIEANKDIDPDGEKLIRVYEDIERISKLNVPENRADAKKLNVYKLLIKKLPWKAPFLDILMNFQVYKDFEKVGDIVNDKLGAEYLSKYIEEWLRMGYAPERYNFSVSYDSKITVNKEAVRSFIDELGSDMSPEDIHALVYKIAKDKGVDAKELFKSLYNGIINKDTGPRFGKLAYAIGISNIKNILTKAIE